MYIYLTLVALTNFCKFQNTPTHPKHFRQLKNSLLQTLWQYYNQQPFVSTTYICAHVNNQFPDQYVVNLYVYARTGLHFGETVMSGYTKILCCNVVGQ